MGLTTGGGGRGVEEKWSSAVAAEDGFAAKREPINLLVAQMMGCQDEQSIVLNSWVPLAPPVLLKIAGLHPFV